MYDIFRFMAFRSPQLADSNSAITINPDSIANIANIQAAMAVGLKQGIHAIPKRNLKPIATAPRRNQFDLSTLKLGIVNLDVFAAFVEAGNTNLAGLDAEINQIWHKSASQLTQDLKYTSDLQSISNALFTIWSSPQNPIPGLSEYTTILMLYFRLLDIIRRVANGDQTLDDPQVLKDALNTIIILPLDTTNPIQPIGFADLMVVRQQLIAYQPGEISYIYNVLKSETENRTTVWNQSSQTQTTNTTTTTQETDKDLQTTERFDLQTQAQNAIQENANFSGSLNVTAQYGTSITVNANGSASSSTAKQNSNQQSTDFAKDIVSQASSKITQTVTQQTVQTFTESFQETNEHGFKNDGPNASNVIGIYQYVDEVYKAQVFNYGKRLMFDVTIPEPAAFLKQVISTKNAIRTSIGKPQDINFAAYQLWDNPTTAGRAMINYIDAAAPYNVSGLSPPPVQYTTLQIVHAIQKELTDGPNIKDQDLYVSDTACQIPDGYQVKYVTITVTGGPYSNPPPKSGWSDDPKHWGCNVIIGQNEFTFGDPSQPGRLPLNTPYTVYDTQGGPELGEIGILPYGIHSNLMLTLEVVIEVGCIRTSTAFAKWQNDTFTTIINQYNNLLSNYNTAQAAAAVTSDGTQFQGSSQTENKRILEAELRKSFLAMLIGDQQGPPPVHAFDSFDAMDDQQKNYGAPPANFDFPSVIVSAALQQAPKTRFFENAFEWQNIQYVFYPYYWGRQSTWYGNVLSEDSDPIFASFMRAGAARIVVPVRPGFEPAVAYFLNTGIIWNGGDLPDITSPLYLSVVEEIKELEDGPTIDNPVAVGDPWTFTLPTTQVILRSDGQLPYWYQDANGNWTPGPWLQDVNGNWFQQYVQNQNGNWVQNPDYILNPDGTWKHK